MSVDTRMRSQINLILDNLPGSAAYPAPDRWGDVDDVDFLYREDTVLCREQYVDRVADAITRYLDEVGWGYVPDGDARQIRRERVRATREVIRLTLPATGTLVPATLDHLDQELGQRLATPDHVLYVSPKPCPATEPVEVPPGTVDPSRPPA